MAFVKFVCWRPLEDWRSLLLGILDPPLLFDNAPSELGGIVLVPHRINYKSYLSHR